MRFKLKEVAIYRKEVIAIESVNPSNYLSTENMLQNKGGKKEANSIPDVKLVSAYKKGDILISNIRPYFKKIWLADTDGGASNDVLIIQPCKISSFELYYILSSDHFFNYMTATSKGTKMPRGDKSSVMEYEFSIYNRAIFEKISKTLQCIDLNIETNKRIVNRLEMVTNELFKNWFIDFEFPNEQGQPYKSSGGKMVESESGMIPINWEIQELEKFTKIVGGKRPNVKTETQDSTNKYPIIGASKIMGYTNEYLFNEELLVMGRVGTHGVIQYYRDEIWPSDNTLVLNSKYINFLKKVLEKVDFKSLNRGSTQPLITQSDIKKIKVVFDKNTIQTFEVYVKPFEELIFQLNLENNKLTLLRDTLLPKLLSGEIELPIKETVEN